MGAPLLYFCGVVSQKKIFCHDSELRYTVPLSTYPAESVVRVDGGVKNTEARNIPSSHRKSAVPPY